VYVCVRLDTTSRLITPNCMNAVSYKLNPRSSGPIPTNSKLVHSEPHVGCVERISLGIVHVSMQIHVR